MADEFPIQSAVKSEAKVGREAACEALQCSGKDFGATRDDVSDRGNSNVGTSVRNARSFY